MSAIEERVDRAYRAVVKAVPEIEGLVLQPYETPPEYEVRMGGGPKARTIAERARQLRRDLGIPFWDAVLLLGTEAGGEANRDALLRAASYHQSPSGDRVVLEREELFAHGFASVPDDGRSWAVSSAVEVESGAELHLPMLDFRCSKSGAELQMVIEISKRLLAKPFVILETAHSYHLLGASLLDFEEFAAFFGRASLFGPLVDRAYIAHQLINGSAALRVTGTADQPAPRACFATLAEAAWDG